jgi:hypothetical protein
LWVAIAKFTRFVNFFLNMSHAISKFAEALSLVESLPVEDQTVLAEVVNKRVAAARRSQIIVEVGEARADYKRGRVKRGSASGLMQELRDK